MEENQNVNEDRKTSSSPRSERAAGEREPIGRKGSESMGAQTARGSPPVMKQGWRELRTKLRTKYDQLTDNDLDAFQGRRKDDLVGFIGERVGGDRSAISRDVDNLARETNYRWD